MPIYLDISIQILSLLGSLASALGLWFGWKQLKKVKTATEASATATDEAVRRLNREFSISELARHNESFTHARFLVSRNEYVIAGEVLSEICSKSLDLLHVPQIRCLLDYELCKRNINLLHEDVIRINSQLENKFEMTENEKNNIYCHLNEIFVLLKEIESKLKYEQPQNI